ncbi:MucR family transcriptional regulator [Methylobacterium sp. E-016]|uniref:MucR family transcriptional regulator n=1 Tax=Methylobacterium sp. E-016 TaxID=2836556 RepID=UPI003918CB30
MNEQVETQSTDFIEIAANLVAAYVSNNRVSVAELPGVIASVHAALSDLGKEKTAEPAVEKLTPAQIKKSVTPAGIISFEDGKTYKTMRRHLTLRGLTPDTYRAKYGLPKDYPIVSPEYSAQRSELARSLGLGQLRRKAAPMASAVDETVSEAPKSSKSKPKAAKAPQAASKASGRKKVADTA